MAVGYNSWRENLDVTRRTNSQDIELDHKTPQVSVILPTYNRAQLLERAVQSVLAQTFQDFELIVVDDASRDRTFEVLKSMADVRLMYIRHPCNRGVAVARNSGIRTSRGALIAFQDSDDEWMMDKLEQQVTLLERSAPDVGVIFTQFWRVRGTGERLFPNNKEIVTGDLFGRLLHGNLISTQVALVKRECFERVGYFDESLPCLIDWDLWLRISRFYHFGCVEQALARVYFTPGSVSDSKVSLAQALEKIIAKHKQALEFRKDVLAMHTYTIGNLLCQGGEFERGRYYLTQAAIMAPHKMRFRLATIVCLLGEPIYRHIYTLKIHIRPDWY